MASQPKCIAALAAASLALSITAIASPSADLVTRGSSREGSAQAEARDADGTAKAGEATEQKAGTTATQGSGAKGADTKSQPSKSKRASPKSRARGSGAASASVPASKGSSGREEKPVLYTNEDLVRFARPEDAKVDSEQAAKLKEKEDTFEAEAQTAQAHQALLKKQLERQKGEAQERVRMAQERLDRLKWLALSEKNPLVAPPQLSDQEKQARASVPAGQRSQRTQEEIQAAEAALAAAQQSLSDITRQLAQMP